MIFTNLCIIINNIILYSVFNSNRRWTKIKKSLHHHNKSNSHYRRHSGHDFEVNRAWLQAGPRYLHAALEMQSK